MEQKSENYWLLDAIGAPFIVANFALEQLIRGDGESVESMIGMMISVGTNIILDPVMMFELRLGISGAAIATVLGNAAAVIYYIVCIQKKDNQLAVLPKYFKLEKDMLKEIFSIGLSAMLLDILLIISSLMFNYYAMKYGDYVLVGFGVSQKHICIQPYLHHCIYITINVLPNHFLSPQIPIEISPVFRDLITVIFCYQILRKPLKTLDLSQVSFPLLFPLCYIVSSVFTNSDKGKYKGKKII